MYTCVYLLDILLFEVCRNSLVFDVMDVSKVDISNCDSVDVICIFNIQIIYDILFLENKKNEKMNRIWNKKVIDSKNERR